MAATKKIRIGIKHIRDLGEGWTLWDTRVSGFCARRRKSEAVFYALKYRTGEGRQRWLTIGRHGAPWTPDAAREEAQRILAEVVQGKDPAAQKLAKRRAATVAELCEEYLMAAAQGRLLTRRGDNKKESTLTTDRSRIEAHIKPLLGDRRVPEVIPLRLTQIKDTDGNRSVTVSVAELRTRFEAYLRGSTMNLATGTAAVSAAATAGTTGNPAGPKVPTHLRCGNDGNSGRVI